MQFFWTDPFKKDYGRLPKDIRERTDRVFERLSENSRHPSLHVKKMESHSDIWEARVSDNYRITFQFVEEGILLRRVGTHNILRQP